MAIGVITKWNYKNVFFLAKLGGHFFFLILDTKLKNIALIKTNLKLSMQFPNTWS